MVLKNKGTYLQDSYIINIIRFNQTRRRDDFQLHDFCVSVSVGQDQSCTVKCTDRHPICDDVMTNRTLWNIGELSLARNTPTVIIYKIYKIQLVYKYIYIGTIYTPLSSPTHIEQMWLSSSANYGLNTASIFLYWLSLVVHRHCCNSIIDLDTIFG